MKPRVIAAVSIASLLLAAAPALAQSQLPRPGQLPPAGGKGAAGWELLGAAAADPTGTAFPDRKDTICSPADPTFNAQELEALVKATGTEEGDWAYPTQTGLEVHSGPQPNSPVVEKLALHFVRVMDDNAPGNQQSPMLKVVTPSGKTGFVPAEALSPLGS